MTGGTIETKYVNCPLCNNSSFKFQFYANLGLRIVKCRNCSLLFANPQPQRKWLKNFYAPGLKRWIKEKEFKKTRLPYWNFYLNLIKKYSSSLSISAESILDIGCGTGLFLELAKKNLNLKTYGIELSKRDCNAARKRADKIICDDTANKQIIKNFNTPIDIITAFDVFEHLPNPNQVMKNINKISSNKTLLLIDTGNIGGFGPKLGKAKNPFTMDKGHIVFYSRKTIKYLLNKHGFSVIKFHTETEIPKQQTKLTTKKVYLQIKRVFTSSPNIIVVGQK